MVKQVDVTRMSPSWASSAGEMISTPRDLGRFFDALLGGKPLRPAQLEEMRTAVATDPQGVAYGAARLGHVIRYMFTPALPDMGAMACGDGGAVCFRRTPAVPLVEW